MRVRRWGLASILLVWGCTQPAPPEPEPLPYDPMLAELGEVEYQRHCASCHGVDGAGDGPVARALAVPPANLRRIRLQRGGVFADGEVARKIDGRFEINAHGSREMPVWGRVFTSDIPTQQAESISRGRIAVLVEYLKSIQDPADRAADEQATRETMRGVFAAMRVLLPLSLDGNAFEDPANAETVQGALALLDSSSADLGLHGASKDEGFAHLARSLAIDARDIRLRYDEGHPREARYLVQTLTETCVACHSRLPAGSAPVSAAFADELDAADLPQDQRAKLAYATRQFDIAEELYAEMIQGDEYSAVDLDMGGHLDDYLELSLRVLGNPERPAALLETFAQRSDLSPVLREDVAAWRASLRRLVEDPPPGSSLDRAQALLGDAPDDGEMGYARTALVDHLAASGLLHRALDGQLPAEDRATAYYLLGWIETRIGSSYWLSEAEAYLESAIRLGPGSDTARRAYALLEEFLVAGYTGSGGSFVPPDIQAKLDLLRWIAHSGGTT